MKKWMIALGLFSSMGALPAGAIPEGEHLADHVKRRYAAEIKCAAGSTDPNRGWCAVAGVQSEKLVLPPPSIVYLGLSMSMLDGSPVLQQMAKNTELAVLCVGAVGDGIKLTRMPESGDDRRQLLGPVRTQVAKSLQAGGGAPIDLSAELYAELQRECRVSRATHGEDTAVDSSPGQNQGGARLFKVGGAFVVMEESTSTRTQVAVIAAAPLRKK